MNLFRDSAHARGVELGPYPLEALPRGERFAPSARIHDAPEPAWTTRGDLGAAVAKYLDILRASFQQKSARIGEGSTDPVVRARELKGAAYYLDASHVGLCEIPEFAWFSPIDGHTHALSIVVAHGLSIEADNLARDWIDGNEAAIAGLRAVEIVVSIAGHIKALGFDARLHIPGDTDVCLPTLGVAGGVLQSDGTQTRSPFLDDAFAHVAITTDYSAATDHPLDPAAKIPTLSHWMGINGAISGREWRRRSRRASHLSRYPMEQVTRRDRPTTLIFDDEVPRVPKRAEFFQRARMGDLGDKAKREVARFAFKHPLTDGMMHPLRAMVPHQDGTTAANEDRSLLDAERNTQAIRSLSYHLGADLTGICEIPNYAWYSHNARGEVIEPRHRYAVVMLIDQGFDTMEGASGDDWISGCQSMRGYIRGAEIAAIMAEFLRARGFDSRPQTNADSEVLQIPLVLLAGLGELSRIGELVLNPFVGPRFKSVVLTTNLPLVPDRPIDFGLQAFCANCLKCARECPVNAIPFGDKVIFNGYEIWKPDVERCTRYRVTNPKGSACGRCMKTCPLNKSLGSDGALAHRVGTWLGIHARFLKPLLVPLAVWLDDRLGYGRRNPAKRWWQDLEMIDGAARVPKATNERDIDPAREINPEKSPVGYYNAADMPTGDAKEPLPVNHRAAIDRARLIETVDEAVARRNRGGAPPAHYTP